jgi:dienelactone hydrolase
VIANANHGFDQADKALLSTLPLDAAQRAQAEEAMNRFLDAMVR